MADYLNPTGFWSYTSSDDRASGGRLSRLRLLLAQHLQLRIGREPKVQIFQDVAAIPYGTDWLKEIHRALDASSFFIPIVTPAFLQSEMCCQEVMHFHAREAALGRDDLIFPLHYIDVDDVDESRRQEVRDPRVLALLRARQMIDFRQLRLRDPKSETVEEKLDAFARSLRLALRRQNGAPAAVGAAPAPPPAPARPAIIAPAATAPGTVVREGPDYPEMVLIPVGSFVMGVPDEEEQREDVPQQVRGRSTPQRHVAIATPFWLGRYPVTRGEFAAFVNDTGHQMPDKAWTYEPNEKGEWQYAERPGRGWRNPGYAQTDRHPVVCVSHADAAAYAEWLSRRTAQQYHLPSEAEWEYAARAGTRTARFWGDGREQACRYANVADRSLMARIKATFDADRFFDGDDGFPFTAPVGTFLPNAFGLHDMLGNVWEWTADPWHDNYNGAPGDGSAWMTGGNPARRVLRGGSWNGNPRNVRAGYRFRLEPGDRVFNVGFRLARTSF
ncbi:MAG TPA: SUMF1/EgtB/PvdO family nonheme iron enzyme [Acetobacteraceae bacterium]|nr:SUMF1/EgtB/PvdO family nonheme iron enzyme [Acetobacteraceae bacterium]